MNTAMPKAAACFFPSLRYSMENSSIAKPRNPKNSRTDMVCPRGCVEGYTPTPIRPMLAMHDDASGILNLGGDGLRARIVKKMRDNRPVIIMPMLKYGAEGGCFPRSLR